MVRFTTNRPICLYTKELFDISRHTLSKSKNLKSQKHLLHGSRRQDLAQSVCTPVSLHKRESASDFSDWCALHFKPWLTDGIRASNAY